MFKLTSSHSLRSCLPASRPSWKTSIAVSDYLTPLGQFVLGRYAPSIWTAVAHSERRLQQALPAFLSQMHHLHCHQHKALVCLARHHRDKTCIENKQQHTTCYNTGNYNERSTELHNSRTITIGYASNLYHSFYFVIKTILSNKWFWLQCNGL